MNGAFEVMNDKMDVIELFGRKALFTGERIKKSDLDDGLYLYHVRGDDDTTGGFAELAPMVIVNHFGSVITNYPIDFGDDGFIAFTEETEPNFLGESETPLQLLEEMYV